MAQLDILIISPIILFLLICLIVYYSISVEMIIPSFFGVKKFRGKKLKFLNYGLKISFII